MRTRTRGLHTQQGDVGDKVVLVTGGNSGIGYACARALARDGERVVIASRNQDASMAAVERICQDTGNHEVFPRQLDLASIGAVRAFVRDLEKDDLPVSTLVCNAGLQVNHGPRLTPDGHELTFATNHLGHFLLVHLMLRRLLSNSPARIVVVASGVHDPSLRTGMPAPDIADMDTLAATGQARADGFDGRLAYVNSKLCNLWFTYELVRRLASAGLTSPEHPLSVHAWEPGLVPGSGLARDYPAPLRLLWNAVLPGVARVATLLSPRINPVGKAGAALAAFARDPALLDGSGRYHPSHTRWQEAASSEASYDLARARELWELSARLTSLVSEDSPLA